MSAPEQLRVPILAYHASNITGNVYQLNDHIAFENDLYTLHHAGYQIVPLLWIAQWLHGERDLSALGNRIIGLSCDDGLDLDYKNGRYFDFGPQRSFYHILKDFVADVGQINQPHAHLTSFVIACQEARKKIDDVSLNSHQLLNHDWWQSAANDDLMAIENHGWDHRHPDIYPTEHANFISVEDEDTATKQVIQAKNLIERHILPQKTTQFAYPWGHTNEFLLNEFMPKQAQQAGITAAYTCGAEHVTVDCNPYNIPRYVCGFNWKSPKQLLALIG